jgi:shikimate kinase
VDLRLDRNIALVGFMTAGKTRVGQALSRMSGLPFIDIDELVETLEGMPIHRIFELRGEPYFRGLESTVLENLCRASGQIIGCGGGTVLNEDNRRRLRDRCLTIWLRVSEKEVRARLEEPGSPRRPMLEGRDAESIISGLMRAREPLYREADYAVETEGRSVEEIAREIALLAGLPLFQAGA